MKRATKFILAGVAVMALAVGSAVACEYDSKISKTGSVKGCCADHVKVAKQAKAGCSYSAKKVSSCKAKSVGKYAGCQKLNARLASASLVSMKGHVVCGSCELGTTKSCASFFKNRRGEVYKMIGNDTLTSLKKVTKHGEKVVKIKGRTLKTDDGSKIVSIESFDVLS